MNIDNAIRKYESSVLSATNTKVEIKYMISRRGLTASPLCLSKLISWLVFMVFIEKHEKVKDLIKAIDEQFANSEKYLVNTLIIQFSTLRLT